MNIQASIIAAIIVAGIIGSMTYVVKSSINAQIEAEIVAATEKTRADLAVDAVRRMETALAEEKTRQAELVEALQAARDLENEATEVLEDRARLDRLTNAKPGLLERLARKATTRTWDDIEADSRE